MFYDFHQARHEPKPVDDYHIPQFIGWRALGRDKPDALLVRHTNAFKGGCGSEAACGDPAGQSNPNQTSDLYLAPRELEVLEWAALGKTAWETGLLLGLTEATVSFYTRKACERLGVKNKTHAVAICISAGLFKV